jgi:cellobiose-specific phosphotransferase system component IIC
MNTNTSSEAKAPLNPEMLHERYLRQIRNAVVTIMIVILVGCIAGVIVGIEAAVKAGQSATVSCTIDNPNWPNC